MADTIPFLKSLSLSIFQCEEEKSFAMRFRDECDGFVIFEYLETIRRIGSEDEDALKYALKRYFLPRALAPSSCSKLIASGISPDILSNTRTFWYLPGFGRHSTDAFLTAIVPREIVVCSPRSVADVAATTQEPPKRKRSVAVVSTSVTLSSDLKKIEKYTKMMLSLEEIFSKKSNGALRRCGDMLVGLHRFLSPPFDYYLSTLKVALYVVEEMNQINRLCLVPARLKIDRSILQGIFINQSEEAPKVTLVTMGNYIIKHCGIDNACDLLPVKIETLQEKLLKLVEMIPKLSVDAESKFLRTEREELAVKHAKEKAEKAQNSAKHDDEDGREFGRIPSSIKTKSPFSSLSLNLMNHFLVCSGCDIIAECNKTIGAMFRVSFSGSVDCSFVRDLGICFCASCKDLTPYFEKHTKGCINEECDFPGCSKRKMRHLQKCKSSFCNWLLCAELAKKRFFASL